MKKEIKDVKLILKEITTQLIIVRGLESYTVERKDSGYQVCPNKKTALRKNDLEWLLLNLKPNKTLFGYFSNGKYIVTFESLFIKDFDTAVEITVNNDLDSFYDWKHNEIIKL